MDRKMMGLDVMLIGIFFPLVMLLSLLRDELNIALMAAIASVIIGATLLLMKMGAI